MYRWAPRATAAWMGVKVGRGGTTRQRGGLFARPHLAEVVDWLEERERLPGMGCQGDCRWSWRKALQLATPPNPGLPGEIRCQATVGTVPRALAQAHLLCPRYCSSRDHFVSLNSLLFYTTDRPNPAATLAKKTQNYMQLTLAGVPAHATRSSRGQVACSHQTCRWPPQINYGSWSHFRATAPNPSNFGTLPKRREIHALLASHTKPCPQTTA